MTVSREVEMRAAERRRAAGPPGGNPATAAGRVSSRRSPFSPAARGARSKANRHWPWLPFFDLAVAAALVPGFLLGGLLAAAAWRGWPWVDTYPALAQAHGHAQLMGWGGALILGVALQFLPRLRGSALVQPERVPFLFAGLAGGLGLRLAGQAVAALVPGAAPAGLWILASGAVLELLAAAGLLALLARTLRSGPSLGQKRAFGQVAPLFAVSAAGLLASLALWAAAAVVTAARAGFGPVTAVGTAAGAVADPTVATAAATIQDPAGRGTLAATLPGPVDAAALRLALFGFVGATSVAMSARVFSLFFRTRPARGPLLGAAAGAFSAGLVLESIAGVVALAGGRAAPAPVGALADLAWGAALLLGTGAVRVFERRLSFPGDKGRYRLWRDPTAVAALLAYAWALVAALVLVLRGLHGLGLTLTPATPPADAALHAVGAGFMTLLIMAVAPTMLPGFGGGRLQGPGWVVAAVVLAALAAVLRVTPGLVQTIAGRSPAWSTAAMALAGAAGAAAIVLLVVTLRRSWRTPAGHRPAGHA
ncbi:hypothetical protein Tmar_1511 [Thermaerobacter marianensis DSM 12885]|uniref:NnrS family protein n=1 Tax=Thermaerobacter marianensis (strain ATCC 700841 / DSM 12885 / JCM 10246 / 7p75a) TaxID=644966 RepID=E6SGH0_THEM7|nr:hypothetical protein [Thermaerobacter marianensis]ADU51622.1 hypothetical protein Tmar_1511 [Thermaerobacter marianensis DSM 12885]